MSEDKELTLKDLIEITQKTQRDMEKLRQEAYERDARELDCGCKEEIEELKEEIEELKEDRDKYKELANDHFTGFQKEQALVDLLVEVIQCIKMQHKGGICGCPSANEALQAIKENRK